MIRIIKILIYFVSVVLLAWLLPWSYHFGLSAPGRNPFTLYSCVQEKFVFVDVGDKGPVYRDFDGGVYTEEEFDSVLPFFYYRQLLTDGKLPDTIKGVAVTPHLISRENFMFRHSPDQINVRSPKLYFLMESMSGRVDLVMPEDVFRMDKGIEFIDMKTNTVNREKSDRFNRVMGEKGIEYPVVDISGNPSVRKEYDQGYLIIDQDHRVFHLKMNAGRPFFRDTEIAPELGMRYAFITEFSNRSMLGFFSDKEHNFYVLRYPSYELVRLPVEGFDPSRESMMIIGDMMNWTFRITGPEREVLYAMNAGDYSLVDYHEYPREQNTWNVAGQYIFPFELSFTSYLDKYVQPRIGKFALQALGLNLLLALVYLFLRRRRIKQHLIPSALIFLLGLFLFVPLLLLERKS